MPPNEKCPVCGIVVADWHREWHTGEDQGKLFQGLAGMDCPFCEALILHGRWQTPLVSAPTQTEAERVKRDVRQAAYWAIVSAGMPLTSYLASPQGRPYARFWSAAEIQKADQYVIENPMVD